MAKKQPKDKKSIVESAVLKAAEPGDGSTINVESGKEPKKGMVVSRPDTSLFLPAEHAIETNVQGSLFGPYGANDPELASQFGDDKVVGRRVTGWAKAQFDPYITKHMEALNAAKHLGSWNNPGTGDIVLNVSDVMPNSTHKDRTKAIRTGWGRNQVGTFELDSGDFIDTGGKDDARTEHNVPALPDESSEAHERRIKGQ